MIKYLGSKRLLLPHILSLVNGLEGVRTVTDLMSGTSRVGHALKGAGYRVHANDHNTYAWVLGRCYVGADADTVGPQVGPWLERLAAAPPLDHWFAQIYARDSRYLQPEQACRIAGMRQALADAALAPALEAVLLTAIMEAADRVDSTVGVQMAWLKQWSRRSHNPVQLRMPAILPGPGSASNLDGLAAAKAHPADLVYLDPPYNQHSYRGNYHLWETLVCWDQPEVYGVARKRTDVRERKSDFNSKRRIRAAMDALVQAIDARYLLLSFSNEGYLDRAELEAILAVRGPVRLLEIGHPRYVGAQIGIHNHKGEKVGKPGKARNTEWLFLVG